MSEIPKEELERIEKEGARMIRKRPSTTPYTAYIAGAKAEHSHLQGRIAELEKEKDSDFPQILKDIRDENERLKGDVIVRDYDLKKQSQEIKRLCGQVEDLKNKLIQEQFKNGNHGG